MRLASSGAQAIMLGTAMMTAVVFPDLVAQQKVSRLTVRPQVLHLKVGQQATIEAQPLNRKGEAVAIGSIHLSFWTPDTAVISVDNQGRVRALREGRGRIKVTAEDVPSFVPVLVQGFDSLVNRGEPAPAVGTSPPPGAAGQAAAILVEPPMLRLVVGEQFHLTPQIVRSDGSKLTWSHFGFHDYPQGVVEVDSVGDVRALGSGQAAILITAPLARDTTIEVRVDPLDLRLSVDTLHLLTGTSDTINLQVPAQGGREYSGNETWLSSDSGVARVSGRGIVTGAAPGPADVRVRVAGVEQALHVVVYPQFGNYNITPPTTAPVAIPMLTTQEFFLEGQVPGTGARFRLPMHWHFTDTALATLDPVGGRLTGKYPGSTTLTATPVLPGVDTIVWKIEVFGGTLVPTRATIGMRVGDRDTLRTVLRDDDNKARPQRAVELKWVSNNSSVIRIREQNEIEAMTVGRATITGTAPWGKTTTVTVFGVSDLLVSAQMEPKTSGIAYLPLKSPREPQPVLSPTAFDSKPAMSPDRTRIAFVSSRSEGRNLIFVMDADGANLAPLDTNPGRYDDPTWSPDGAGIFFTVTRNGRSQIWSMKADGSGRRPITDSAFSSAAPAVSPDGTTMVFESVRRGGQYDLYKLSLADPHLPNAAAEQLLPGSSKDNDRSPRFLPDNDLAFIVEQVGGNQPSRVVKRLYAGGTEPQLLSPAGLEVRSFAVAPDGKSLALEVRMSDEKTKQSREVLYLLDLSAPGTPAPLYDEPQARLGTPSFVP